MLQSLAHRAEDQTGLRAMPALRGAEPWRDWLHFDALGCRVDGLVGFIACSVAVGLVCSAPLEDPSYKSDDLFNHIFQLANPIFTHHITGY